MSKDAGLRGTMDLARAVLPTYNVAVASIDHEKLLWVLDSKGRPCILVGYGSEDPKRQVKIQHMLKFHVGISNKPVFNIIQPKDTNPVKHTIVSAENVKVLAAGIPFSVPCSSTKELRKLTEWLCAYHDRFLESAYNAFKMMGCSFIGAKRMATAQRIKIEKMKRAEKAKARTQKEGEEEDSLFVGPNDESPDDEGPDNEGPNDQHSNEDEDTAWTTLGST